MDLPKGRKRMGEGINEGEMISLRDFQAVQWLRLHAPNARGPGSTPTQGTRSHTWQLKIQHVEMKIENPKYQNEDLEQPDK